ncbi:Integral membrane protein [Tritrichomonas foetus]|uniref:Integral membrane protein n=1 Tax=Tritrichomonas foetus TaxID=1144522 RepID=A0A1J4KFE8_9EUKA|nr:Integral membrane protein [Tritrichomonas foetus]|eukprot:OHT10167.1 Integral membrane protein [Tritrichomonas foetus]
MKDTILIENSPKSCFYHFGSIMGFSILCFLYGTSYGIAILGLETYTGSTLIALRMIFGFFATALICIIRVISQPKIRLDIIDSIKNRKIDMLKSAFGGIMYYGFPHSLIGVAQDGGIPSNTVHIAQSCVPFFAFIFANFMLADEKFSFKRFYPQVLALIGTILTTIPTIDSDWGNPTVKDYIFLCVAIASFGFGSVYMKSHLSSCEPTLCGFFQLFGSAVYSVLFAVFYDKPSGFVASLKKTTYISILWPLILGMVHTCGCAYAYLWTVKRLGAVISSFSNFGQIVIGILIGVFFFHEWNGYLTKDYIMSAVGLVTLTLAIVCGFLGDREPKGIKRDDSMQSLVSEQTRDDIPEYDAPNVRKPLLS